MPLGQEKAHAQGPGTPNPSPSTHNAAESQRGQGAAEPSVKEIPALEKLKIHSARWRAMLWQWNPLLLCLSSQSLRAPWKGRSPPHTPHPPWLSRSWQKEQTVRESKRLTSYPELEQPGWGLGSPVRLTCSP